jgi:hypothetical protein
MGYGTMMIIVIENPSNFLEERGERGNERQEEVSCVQWSWSVTGEETTDIQFVT